MFISCEWTKEENLCVDTIIFLGATGKKSRFFSTFFPFSISTRVNQIMVKAFQAKD